MATWASFQVLFGPEEAPRKLIRSQTGMLAQQVIEVRKDGM